MNPLTACLNDHCLTRMFIEELGWDRSSGSVMLTIDGREWVVQRVAQKRGLQVCWVRTDRLVLMNRKLLQELQRVLTRTVHEHILVFSCEEPRKQVWLWSVHLPGGRKLRHREHPFFSAQPPLAFLDRLAKLGFTLEEEDAVGLTDAIDRVRCVLDTSAELNLFARKPKLAARSDRLAIAMGNGDAAARHEFILMHRGLARKLSKVLRKWFNMPPEGAEQIGILGLMEAAQRFRPELGYQFSTYASWWVRQSCQRLGPNAALLIRTPHHAFWGCFKHAIKLSKTLAAKGPAAAARYQSECEAADPKLAKQWANYLRARNVLSLAEKATFRTAAALPDRLPCVVNELIDGEDTCQIRLALAKLYPRSADIIRCRFGIDSEPQTLQEIAFGYGLSKERVRQIEAAALKQLRGHFGIVLHECDDDKESGVSLGNPTGSPGVAVLAQVDRQTLLRAFEGGQQAAELVADAVR